MISIEFWLSPLRGTSCNYYVDNLVKAYYWLILGELSTYIYSRKNIKLLVCGCNLKKKWSLKFWIRSASREFAWIKSKFSTTLWCSNYITDACLYYTKKLSRLILCPYLVMVEPVADLGFLKFFFIYLYKKMWSFFFIYYVYIYNLFP